MRPILQVALDFIDLNRAVKLAKETVAGGCDWLEVGTPLIKSEGLGSIRQFRQLFPKITIVADMKIMDAGRTEVEIAAKSGADIVTVLGHASNETIKECVNAAKNYGAKIMVDLIEVDNYIERAKEVESFGVDYIGLHIPIDEQMTGKISFDKLKKVTKTVKIPVAIAGGINSETAVDAVNSGASIIIVGGAITKSVDAKKSTQQIKNSIIKKLKVKTELYRRVTENNVKEILLKVSTANLSDALHRGLPLKGLIPIINNKKMVGQAVTVRTYPGDWAKPVEAIDVAKKGDVIVIDAGGVPPAVWGELATNSANQKKLAGVVINGAVRDVREIRKLSFPVFAKLITPQAGEPKGFGEINVPIVIEGIRIFAGDWIVGDDDGVIVIPQKNITEITNRAMDVLEKENRIRGEILKNKTTLGNVTELLKWEKK